jgi:tRNA(Ile)-lysidine synthase
MPRRPQRPQESRTQGRFRSNESSYSGGAFTKNNAPRSQSSARPQRRTIPDTRGRGPFADSSGSAPHLSRQSGARGSSQGARNQDVNAQGGKIQSGRTRSGKTESVKTETRAVIGVKTTDTFKANDVRALFSPALPSSFALEEQRRLFIDRPATFAAADANGAEPLEAERRIVAFERYIAGFAPLDNAAELRALFAEHKREDAHAAPRDDEKPSKDDDRLAAPRPAAKAPKRAQQAEESPETRSPFDDVITSMQEVLIARNAGRYIPSPKQHAERPRPPGVDLHPAIGFKLYAPNFHASRHFDNRKHTRRHGSGAPPKEQMYPAAVPFQDVFGAMPAETQAYHRKLEKFLRSEADLQGEVEIVVAVSGGVDSIVLLDMLMCLAERLPLHVAVVHFNHRLRGKESEADAYFVRETCKRYHIPCYIAWADVERFASIQNMSIERAGRELRYKFLEFIAYKRRADAVLTAHTLNDSVETVLMNMLRGSGLAGLAGIPSQRAFGEHTKLARPLLGMRKTELIEYARLRGLSWREDSSNAESLFRRNKVRNELVPLLEKEYSSNVVEVLHRTSQILAGADELVRDSVEHLLPSLLVENEAQGYVSVNLAPLRIQKRFLQSEIIRRIVQRRFGVALNFDAVDRILALLDAETGAKADIVRGIMALRDRATIILAATSAVYNINVRVEKNNHYDFGGWRIFLEEIDRKNVKFTNDPAVEYVDSRLLPYRMTLRTWRAGDVFTPLGMKGTMKVSDYLTNSKIPLPERQHVMALTAATPNGEEIVWLCGLRVSDAFKLSPDARSALRLEFRRPKGVTLPAPHFE